MKKIVLIVAVLASSFSVVASTQRIGPQLFDNNKCGLDGTIQERIQDCSTHESARKDNFVLVSNSWISIYLDEKTGLLWGPSFPGSAGHYNHKDALTVCQEKLKGYLTAGIEADWRLPSKSDFETAAKNGLDSILAFYYWTSDIAVSSDGSSNYAWAFSSSFGADSKTFIAYRKNAYDFQVVCVAGKMD